MTFIELGPAPFILLKHDVIVLGLVCLSSDTQTFVRVSGVSKNDMKSEIQFSREINKIILVKTYISASFVYELIMSIA